jgi:hypothetical protein
MSDQHEQTDRRERIKCRSNIVRSKSLKSVWSNRTNRTKVFGTSCILEMKLHSKKITLEFLHRNVATTKKIEPFSPRKLAPMSRTRARSISSITMIERTRCLAALRQHKHRAVSVSSRSLRWPETFPVWEGNPHTRCVLGWLRFFAYAGVTSEVTSAGW